MSLKESVKLVMRSPPVTALFSDTVSSVIEKIISNNIGAVIVMIGDVPSGIVTERDIIVRLVRDHKDPKKKL